jgi:hypothetical protein
MYYHTRGPTASVRPEQGSLARRSHTTLKPWARPCEVIKGITALVRTGQAVVITEPSEEEPHQEIAHHKEENDRAGNGAPDRLTQHGGTPSQSQGDHDGECYGAGSFHRVLPSLVVVERIPSIGLARSKEDFAIPRATACS